MGHKESLLGTGAVRVEYLSMKRSVTEERVRGNPNLLTKKQHNMQVFKKHNWNQGNCRPDCGK